MNPQSSRSHCIFTIVVSTKQFGAEQYKRAKVHLVDLAGYTFLDLVIDSKKNESANEERGRGNKFFCYDYFDEIFLKVKRNNM